MLQDVGAGVAAAEVIGAAARHLAGVILHTEDEEMFGQDPKKGRSSHASRDDVAD